MTPHEQAKWRRRRIIMNNDGCDMVKTDRDSFLASRTSPLADSQVDSIFYCTGIFNAYSHPSQVSQLLPGFPTTEAEAVRGFERIEQINWNNLLAKAGEDSLGLIVEWCRDHDREVFWSMRMNDQHDSTRPHLISPWKRRHKDWLMNEKEGYPLGSWSLVNYDHPEARETVFRIIEDVVTRYEVDGLELDFMRYPCFFKTQIQGKPVTQAQRDMMTGLVRRVRAMMQEQAERRSKPLLLAVRVADDIGYCRELGLELDLWLEEGLVDMVASADHFKLRSWSDFAALGKHYHVPVYACFVERRFNYVKAPESVTPELQWRGEALRAWQTGVDGIYTFNLFNPRSPLFRELGDPDVLKTTERYEQESFVAPAEGYYGNPGFWLKDGRRFLQGQNLAPAGVIRPGSGS